MTVLGVLGGSGVYEIAGLARATWRRVASPFGETSDEFLFGVLDGLDVVFAPRHGRGHRHSPTTINYRANIDALKRAGVTDLLSLSACGSLREDLPPGHFMVVDQFIDRTFAREKSFFGEGLVAHVSMGHPTCRRIIDHLDVEHEERLSLTTFIVNQEVRQFLPISRSRWSTAHCEVGALCTNSVRWSGRCEHRPRVRRFHRPK